jgi:uncharacterized protein
MMSSKFIKDPREVVKAGDVVKVKVLEVDAQRKRIALTMRLEDSAPRVPAAGDAGARPFRNDRTQNAGRDQPRKPQRAPEPVANVGSGLMADALAQALKRK